MKFYLVLVSIFALSWCCLVLCVGWEVQRSQDGFNKAITDLQEKVASQEGLIQQLYTENAALWEQNKAWEAQLSAEYRRNKINSASWRYGPHCP